MKNKILNLIEDKLKEIDIKVETIDYLKEEGTNFLRIEIDKEGLVSSEDCVKATKIINPILDKENIIEDTYILDVCSKERG